MAKAPTTLPILVRFPIRRKFMFGLGVIITLMIISNGVVLYQLDMLSSSATTTLTTNVSAIGVIRRLQSVLVDEERAAKKFLVLRDGTYSGIFSSAQKEFDVYMDSLLIVHPDVEGRELIHQIRQSNAWFVDMMGHERERVTRKAGGAAEALSRAITDSVGSMELRLDQLVRLNQNAIGVAMTSVELATGHSLAVALILTLVTLALAIGLSVFIARTITYPIEHLILGTEKIASGSFDPIRVSSKDEIAQLADAINEMSYKLKEINEYKANMTHQISHELRSPLTTILGAHYLLTNKKVGSLNQEQQRLLDIVRDNVDRLTSFSQQFLDLARIEAGMMQYHFERTDIVPLVGKMAQESEIAASSKNIRIVLRLTPAPEVMIDIEKMTVVMSNLLSNAIKYTQQNGVVQVEAGPSDRGVRISVADSGIGISKDDLPRIFTKFYKARNAEQSGIRGTGVGLALVKAFVDGHGATITVDSAIGAGSTFTIELPIASGDGIVEVPVTRQNSGDTV